MEEQKVKGIVLKSVDLKDSDKLITIFSLEKGQIKAKARGVKKNKAKLSFATQPFALIEFVLVSKSGFYTVINASSVDQFFDITSDFDNYIFMMSCLEICEKCVAEGDPNPELFFLLLNSLKLVCYEKVSASNIFIKFLIESIKSLGYLLELGHCSICGGDLRKSNKFSFETNGFICDNCSSGQVYVEIEDSISNILKKIDETDFDSLKNLKFVSRENVITAIKLLCRDFKFIVGEEILTIKQYL